LEIEFSLDYRKRIDDAWQDSLLFQEHSPNFINAQSLVQRIIFKNSQIMAECKNSIDIIEITQFLLVLHEIEKSGLMNITISNPFYSNLQSLKDTPSSWNILQKSLQNFQQTQSFSQGKGLNLSISSYLQRVFQVFSSQPAIKEK